MIHTSLGWYMRPDDFVGGYDFDNRSYEHLFDRLFQNSIFFVVKIAVHRHEPRQICVDRDPGW